MLVTVTVLVARTVRAGDAQKGAWARLMMLDGLGERYPRLLSWEVSADFEVI